MSSIKLHESRLATTDENGHRVYLHPEDVHGIWRKRRTFIYWFLISIYLVIPWLEVGGKQTILLDIVHREFTFFGTSFHAHDTTILFFILGLWLFLFAMLTSLYGRVWCGFACPQTVFIDTLYRGIEKLTEGTPRQQKLKEGTPWDANRIVRRTIKWLLFIAVSALISHSFIGYFVGAKELVRIVFTGPSQNYTLFFLTMLVTTIFLVDFGWFREQFCIIACPYGRLQSLFSDPNSLLVTYDNSRTDCIDCGFCVKVCPTGIDIRRGPQQLECISCTACIDACDTIMEKVEQPKGLIKFSSEAKGKSNSLMKWFRTGVYSVIFIGLISGLTYNLMNRTEMNVTMVRGRGLPFSTITHGEVRQISNQFLIHIFQNKVLSQDITYKIYPEELRDKIEVVIPGSKIKNQQGKYSQIVFFKFLPDILTNGEREVEIELESEGISQARFEFKLLGPIN
jgi:polyferredoxin